MTGVVDNNQGAGRIQGYKAFMKEVEQPPELPQPDPEEYLIVDLKLSIPGVMDLPIKGTIKRENGT